MISADTLSAAVEAKIINPDQAQRLIALEQARLDSGAEPDDDEKLRFISGFGDIFVTLGLTLFLSAASYFMFSVASGLGLWAGLVIMSWLLAEFFTRRRRMALPSIVLLLTFIISVFSLTFILANAAFNDGLQITSLFDGTASTSALLASVVTAAAAALHYWRFKVPITIAAGVAALVCAMQMLLYLTAPSFTTRWQNELILMFGLAAFALAMRYDLADPQRLSRRTDIAFWLHLLAAPLIVHPLVSGMMDGRGLPDNLAAGGVLGIFFALGIVSVLIDRRALLVSGLSYAGFAFASLLNQTGLSYGTIAPATLLALGAFVLLLSAGWHPVRSALISRLPYSISSRLPAPHNAQLAGLQKAPLQSS